MSNAARLKEKQKELKKEEKKHKKSWKSKIAPKDWRVRDKSSGSAFSLEIVLPAGGDSVHLKLDSASKVGEVKQEIKAKAGYFPTQYKLTYEGCVLEDTKTLDVYNIASGARVCLVLHSGMSGYGYRPEEVNHATLNK